VSDIAELWSLPWHELQRSLAAVVGAQAAGQASGNGAITFKVAGSPCAFSPAGSWLGRTRARPRPLYPSAAK